MTFTAPEHASTCHMSVYRSASIFLRSALIVLGASVPVLAQASVPQVPSAATSPLTYTLQVGDLVELRFPYAEELDVTAPVRPDGKLAVPHAGEIRAAGLTPSELREAICHALEGTLRDPEVTVVVKEFRTQRVFVTGEVTTAGPLEYRPGMTALQALSAAGGYRETASRQALLVLRHAGPDTLQVTSLDVRRKAGRINDFPLRPDDIVLVPRSGIAKVNQAIRQYVRGVLPVSNLGLFFDLVGSSGATVGLGPGE